MFLKVDDSHGKTILELRDTLHVHVLQTNLMSMQWLRNAKYVFVYDERPRIVVIKKRYANGTLQQVALMSKSPTYCPTLDCLVVHVVLHVPSSKILVAQLTCCTVVLDIVAPVICKGSSRTSSSMLSMLLRGRSRPVTPVNSEK